MANDKVYGIGAHGMAGVWGSGVKEDFTEGTREEILDKICAGWDGLNRHVSRHEIVISFGASSYLHLYPDGTYCYYETAT